MQRITKIYTGKDNACRCGCKGQYVTADDPIFAKRLKRFEKMLATYEPKKDDICEGVYFNISYGDDRAITAYFD